MNIETAIPTISRYFPEIQAVYLFGSFGTEDERTDSDVDLALLLPPAHRYRTGLMLELAGELIDLFGRSVDLINVRETNTVFQKEIIMSDQRVYCANQFAADEFEMMVVSKYQKLNEERQDIIADGLAAGRFVA